VWTDFSSSFFFPFLPSRHAIKKNTRRVFSAPCGSLPREGVLSLLSLEGKRRESIPPRYIGTHFLSSPLFFPPGVFADDADRDLLFSWSDLDWNRSYFSFFPFRDRFDESSFLKLWGSVSPHIPFLPSPVVKTNETVGLPSFPFGVRT